MEMEMDGRPQISCSKWKPVIRERSGTGTIPAIPSRMAEIYPVNKF